MKRILSIALIMSIAVIAGFSAFAVNHASNEHGHVGCLSAAMPVTACPADIMAMFLFHAGILKSLLLSIVGNISAVMLVAVALCATFIFVARERAGPALVASLFLSLIYTSLVHSRAPFTRWLSLRENSPSFSFSA